MKKVRVMSFQNQKTGNITNLFLGFTDNVPVYQFDTKEIPITGEFTGFPKSIMIKWMESIGYTLESDIPVRGCSYHNDQKHLTGVLNII